MKKMEDIAADVPRNADTLPSAPAREIPLWPGLVVALLVGIVYMSVATSGTFRFRPSLYPHHVLIADAWLHGQLYVRDEVIEALNEAFYRGYRTAVERSLAASGQQLADNDWDRIRSGLTPPTALDWSVVDGKRYGYWGPMVSFLLLPYVAAAGLQASDVLFGCLIGTGTVLLMFLTLRRANDVGWIRLTTAACVALTLLFGLGTVHFYLAVIGRVWFLSQIVATFFVTLAVYCVLHHHQHSAWSVAAGAAFAAGMLARDSIVATVPFFFLALCASPQRTTPVPWRGAWARALGFSLPVLLAVGVTLAFSYARFGDAFESGAGLQLRTGAHIRFRQDYLQHGLFSLHYLSRNIYFYFFNPLLVRHPLTGALSFDPEGNSMFLVTPALLYVFRSQRRRNWFTVCLWAGAGTCLLMLLLFMGTGWYQFGNRYLLDLMPLAIFLIAVGMEGRLTLMSAILIILSIVANAWGTYRFLRA